MTFKLLEFCVIGLKARYPFLHVRTPGMSVMGKPIYFVHLGSGAGQVFFNAAHHANEWITSTLLMTWLENTAQALAMDEQILGSAGIRSPGTRKRLAGTNGESRRGWIPLACNRHHLQKNAIPALCLRGNRQKLFLQARGKSAVDFNVAAVEVIGSLGSQKNHRPHQISERAPATG